MEKRKTSARYFSSSVNGRAKYWSGGCSDKNNYIDIPGGMAFENFEFRENIIPGKRFILEDYTKITDGFDWQSILN